ncbi:helix-turn-helix domain-containing protein [Shouchella patagoniensis]|uniref:helix-turn-helix domain-containing protein n=1 Tax=Shouchella patagoniensis TaxID=228576 RepID=UPI0009959947|nr:GAF domain-containing protein [Shouchella patagoniensis]
MKKEKQLLSLMQSIRVLSSARELPDVLHQLIQEALQVIDGSTSGVLFLYDEQQDALYAESAIGFNMKALGKVRLKPGEGMSGKTFELKKGSIYSNLVDTKVGMANLSSHSAKYYGESLAEWIYPKSAISVPLHASAGTCIGVLTVDIFEQNRQFEEEDLELLEMFARQASIAIENARLYSQNKRTQEIHKALSRVSLSNGGLDEITAALARLISKDVLVVNEFSEELSSYTYHRHHLVLTNHLSDKLNSIFSIGKSGVQKWNSKEVHAEFYSFPIQIESVTIGMLVIAGEKDALLDPLDQIAIEQALPIFAMELNQREKKDVDDFVYAGSLLEMAIHSSNKEVPYQELMMHIPAGTNQNYVVAKVQMDHCVVPVPSLNRMKQQLLRKVYYEMSKLSETVIVYERHFDLTFLFPLSTDLSIEQVKPFLHELLNYADATWNLSGCVGIGSKMNKLSEIQESHAEAVQAITFLQRMSVQERIIDYEELGPYRLFLKMEETDLRQYVIDTIGVLINHDQQGRGELVKTMKVYMEQGQHLNESAHALYVHVNTVKYRLKKIYQLLKVSSLSVSHAFEIELAIKIADYLERYSISDNR